MATHQANPFALLDDEESDDVSKLLERVASKARDSSRPSTVEKVQQSQNVRTENGRGRGVRSTVKEVEQKQNGNGRPIGYRQGNGQDHGYTQGYRRDLSGYHANNGRTNPYRVDNGRVGNYSRDADGNQLVHADGYQRNYGGNGQGRGRGQWRGLGRGRIIGRGRGGEIHGGDRGQEGGFGATEGNWTEIRRQNGGGFRRSMSQESHYLGGREGTDNGTNELNKSSDTKEDNVNKEHMANVENGTPGNEGNVPASTEVPKDAELEQRIQRQLKAKEEREKEKNKMTLEEYEKKVLVEKRKALEAQKTKERKVTLDKDLESMQLVRKNKEDDDVLIKLNSEKEKLKRGNGDKEEKGRKAVSINEFLKPADDRRRGQFIRRPRYSILVEDVDAPPANGDIQDVAGPTIGDLLQFPILGAAVVKRN